MAIQAVERALKRAEGFEGVIDGKYVGHRKFPKEMTGQMQ